MDFGIFCKTFYLVFLVLIAVGPGFLTIANIAMTRGLKTSAVAVCGCFLGDCIYMVLGALCAKEIVAAIPQSLSLVLSIVAICLLLYLAYSFYKVDIKTLKAREFSKKSGLSLAVSLFCLKMTSPICMVGYSIIFTQVIATNTTSNVLSAILGGCTASFVENIFMITTFSTVGKKMKTGILSMINKFSAVFIACFALFLVAKLVLSLVIR